MIRTLIADPIGGLLTMVFMLPGLILGMGLHEWGHAYAAVRMGDDTPRQMGRLTLNPLKHVDWAGFALFLILGFGWAKPVPTNPLYYDDRRKGRIVVSLAGIGMNLVLCLAFALCWRLTRFLPAGVVTSFLRNAAYWGLNVNAMLAILNLLPIAPLDGSKLFDALFPGKLGVAAALDRYGMVLLLVLSLTGILGLVVGRLAGWLQTLALWVWSWI